ncbi:hypothetical protein Tco_0878737 [Tanacetum coccineum]|uniref:Uncharacterized protein n=1 Tax=Tanacetum coccineum TaxID=301880 RepID=A0ABQ5BYR2_9ASTR
MVISSPCLTDIRNWLVQKQTAFGKDFSNLFTTDSLLKTNNGHNLQCFTSKDFGYAPCYSNEALAIPEQTTTGKEISNPFMAGDVSFGSLEDFTTYCCWFNIGAASEDLVLLRKIEENSLSL